ncbi:MAG: hypothetical protein LC749_02515 [Actinobacteria bacterium]|nr:hypothetical protein [Actinomycetota bacterium]
MIRRLVSILSIATVGVGVLAHGASADPSNAKNSVTVPLTCDGTLVQFVVIGNGDITPGHVVGSTRTFIPQSFDLTFIFTHPDGTIVTETFTPSKKNPPGDLITCTLHWTRNTADGTVIVGFGTVTGFFTPA